MPQTLYQTALGIDAGNYLTTEHGGPYRVVGISAPYFLRGFFDTFIIYHQAVVDTLIEEIFPHGPRSGNPILGPIGRDDDGTYWTEQNMEVIVVRGDAGVQLDMFLQEPPEAQPYVLQSGVNYDVADGLLWHCGVCGRDFNTPEDEDRRCAPECRFCDTWTRAQQIVMMRALPRDRAKASSYQRKLGITDDRLVRTPSAGKMAV